LIDYAWLDDRSGCSTVVLIGGGKGVFAKDTSVVVEDVGSRAVVDDSRSNCDATTNGDIISEDFDDVIDGYGWLDSGGWGVRPTEWGARKDTSGIYYVGPK